MPCRTVIIGELELNMKSGGDEIWGEGADEDSHGRQAGLANQTCLLPTTPAIFV